MRKINLRKALAGAQSYIEDLRSQGRKLATDLENHKDALDETKHELNWYKQAFKALSRAQSELVGIVDYVSALQDPSYLRAKSTSTVDLRAKSPEELEFDRYCNMDTK